jgi:hypothetical protein
MTCTPAVETTFVRRHSFKRAALPYDDTSEADR